MRATTVIYYVDQQDINFKSNTNLKHFTNHQNLWKGLCCGQHKHADQLPKASLSRTLAVTAGDGNACESCLLPPAVRGA